MLDIKQINALQSTLCELLLKLKAGEIHAIEYGDPNHPAGWQTFLRLYYMNTAGGHQFCLKQVSHCMESGGIYEYEKAAISSVAMNAVLRYHRPTGLSARLQEIRKEREVNTPAVSFFAINDPSELTESHARAQDMAAYNAKDFLPDAEEVVLTLKGK